VHGILSTCVFARHCVPHLLITMPIVFYIRDIFVHVAKTKLECVVQHPQQLWFLGLTAEVSSTNVTVIFSRIAQWVQSLHTKYKVCLAMAAVG
jgi:hypothetical protein